MPVYEYKVIPAPKKGQRSKGVRGSENRFAHALQSVMNDQAADGWEYLRNDTLPCEERKGLRGKTTTYQNMLVFRRVIETSKAVPELETVESDVARGDPPLTKPVETAPLKLDAVDEPVTKKAPAIKSPFSGSASDPSVDVPLETAAK